MPKIASFLDMDIYMYWRDHNLPHINIICAEHKCNIDLEGNILNGSLPANKYKIIKKWMLLHKQELLRNWDLIKKLQHPERIDPWE
jgi:hypothetical protein